MRFGLIYGIVSCGIGLLLVGCGVQEVVVSNPLKETIKKNQDTSYAIRSGNSDNDIRMLFYVIANEGKKHGAKYFVSNNTVVNYLDALNAYQGFPLTTVGEVLQYCEKDMLGGKRPRCLVLRDDLCRSEVRYMVENKEVDVLAWDIEETLNDPEIKKVAKEYKFYSYNRKTNEYFPIEETNQANNNASSK